MPASVIETFAPMYAEREGLDKEAAKEKLEQLWDRAKRLAIKKFDATDDQYWSYVMGIWKRMAKYEDNESTSSSRSAMMRISIRM